MSSRKRSYGHSKRSDSPPPPTATFSKQGYHTLNSINQKSLSGSFAYGFMKKKGKTEDEYFDEEEEASEQMYQPAPGSPGEKIQANDSSDEEDPLDAFMAGVEQEVSRQNKTKPKKVEKDSKAVRQDIDNEDVEESYYKYMEENPNAGKPYEESDEECEYDADGNPIISKKRKYIDPLEPVDHSAIPYEDFTKNFYQEHEEITALLPQQVAQLKDTLGIRTLGFDIPKPVSSFGHFGFDDALIKAIRKSDYTSPTPIQSQAVPIALSGRDIIGIAKTGSGKTAAFIWPLLVHIMDQKELEPGDGPIGLILAPTRELAQQIYVEAKKFGKVYNIQVVCAYGGGNKWEQSKALEAGAELVVATPGRMIDMIKVKATNFNRVTFLVLDEADRMFDMGFEPQVRSICDHVRPDRQTLLFSATFKKKVERLARDALTDPIKIVQGELGEANEDITQKVHLFTVGYHKWNWLLAHLVEFMSSGSVIIFVTKKANSEELCNNLKLKEFDALLLHGDMTQFERNDVITAFKKKDTPILVATDVAARGLDIPHIKTVVNYDIARDIDTHTHRIGRTGRAGEKGMAYTLVTNHDKEFVGHLVRNLEGANQEVPSELMDLAMQSSWFRKSRFKSGEAKALGGRGLGLRERPGLGSEGARKVNSNRTGVYGLGPAAVANSPHDPLNLGPASNRLSALKSAFQSQFQSQFISSEKAVPWSSEMDLAENGMFPPPPGRSSDQPRKRKKSRWDE